jgi:hypothetical protein
MRKRFYLTALAVAAVMISAEAVPSTAQSVSAASASGAQCSGTLLTSVSKSVLPQGSTAFKYTMPDGTGFANVAPPAGFDVMTASKALLTELDLPARPTASTDVQSWKAQVAPFSNFAIDGTEKFCVSSTPIAPLPPAGSVGHAGNNSWSGYEARDEPYEQAVGHFVQPAVTVSGSSQMVNWVGLNGVDPGGRLIQAGTYNQPGSPTVGTVFFELYCAAYPNDGCIGPQLMGPNASPGSTVSVNVGYDPSTLKSYYQVAIGTRTVLNVPNYQDWAGTNSGATADFITERNPSYNVPNFEGDPILFSASRTYVTRNGSTYVYLGDQDYFADEATGDGQFYTPPCSTSAEIIMYPNNLSGGTFLNNWCAATAPS